MNPARLVPVLATLVAAASAAAMDIGDGVRLDGFGEAYARVEEQRSSFVRNAVGDDETWIHFPADVDLRLRWDDEDFAARADVVVYSEDQPFGDDVLLEQAFIDWHASERLTLRGGRFQNTWLGWEGFHTPEMWRVNHSAAWDWNIQNHGLGRPRPFLSDGVGARWKDGGLTVEGYVVDDVLGDGPGQRGYHKAAGGAVSYAAPQVARIELGVAFDPNSTNDGRTDDASNAFAVDLNADLRALESAGWFFAAEVQVHRHPALRVGGVRYGNDLVALAMANYAFKPGKASLTAMVDYVERGFEADDNEILEYALALLTTPRRYVRLNTELFYWDESAADADAYGGAAVLLVELP